MNHHTKVINYFYKLSEKQINKNGILVGSITAFIWSAADGHSHG
jgi:hypothetical protein